MDIKQLYKDNLQKLLNEYGVISVMSSYFLLCGITRSICFFFCNAIHLITFCFGRHVAIMFLAPDTLNFYPALGYQHIIWFDNVHMLGWLFRLLECIFYFQNKKVYILSFHSLLLYDCVI